MSVACAMQVGGSNGISILGEATMVTPPKRVWRGWIGGISSNVMARIASLAVLDAVGLLAVRKQLHWEIETLIFISMDVIVCNASLVTNRIARSTSCFAHCYTSSQGGTSAAF